MKHLIKKQFTVQEIKLYNQNAKSQKSSNFDETIKTALEYSKDYYIVLSIMKTAVSNAVNVKKYAADFFECSEEEAEDCKQYK